MILKENSGVILLHTLKQKMIISVEGSIGAGKTTLLKRLENETFPVKHILFYEPVDDWSSFIPRGSDLSLFELYYANKQKYGFTFQMYILQSRFQSMLKVISENPDKLIICERCHITDCHIFAKMLYQGKIITEIEYEIYNRWYNMVCGVINKRVDSFIYLRVTPELCMERIAKRNRRGEESMESSYIEKLCDLHEEWLMPLAGEACLVIDDVDLEYDRIKQYITDHSTRS